MIPAYRIAVVVVTHRHDQGLERCLSSVLPLLREREDLIFVDNGSAQNVGVRMSTLFPGITTVTLAQNFLYCGGYNAGIRLAIEREYEFVLILNADTEVINAGFLAELVGAANRSPGAAFVGPLVYWRSENVVQKTCLQFPRIYKNVLIWLPWRLSRTRFEQQPCKETEVEFLNGVCVLCRTAALKEIGLLDENFGGYVEDADWSWRAREKGWISLFVPAPSIIHHEEGVGYEPYSLKTFLLKRNTVLWYLKVGRRLSAVVYACAATSLAWVRMLLSPRAARKKHAYFLRRLCRTYRALLRGGPMGDWFGPPIGPWDSTITSNTRT